MQRLDQPPCVRLRQRRACDLRVAGPERELDRRERHGHAPMLLRRRRGGGGGCGRGDGARRVAAQAQGQGARRDETGRAQDAQGHLRAEGRRQGGELGRRRVADRQRRGARRARRGGERELLHAVVVAVGDGQHAVAVEAQAAGVDELAEADPAHAEGSEALAAGAELLDAVVAAVGDPQVAGGVEGDLAGRLELADLAALAAELVDLAARRVVDLDAVARGGQVGAAAIGAHRDAAALADPGRGAQVAAAGAEARDALVARVGHDDGPAPVDGQRRRVEELARPAARRADRAHREPGAAGEDDDPRAPAIEDVGVAAGVEGHGDRIGEDRRPRRRRAPGRRQRAVGVEQLHAAVDRVGHRADPAGVGRDAHRRVELPGAAAGGAERAQQRAALVEDVDAVVAGVGHVHVAGRVDRDPARVGEPARSRPVGAPAALVGIDRPTAEAHDAVVEVVGDEHAPRRVGGDAVGEVELTGARSVLAHRAQQVPAGVEDDEPMVLVVGHEEPRPADCDAARVGELARRHDLGAVAAVEREALDPVVAGVGHVDGVARHGETAARGGGVARAAAEAELAHVAAGPAPGVDELTVGVEAIDAVRAVGHQHRAVARHGERPDAAELAGLGPRDAELAAEAAVRAEDLDDVRALVGHVDRAVGADRQRLGEAHDALGALSDLGRGDVRTRHAAARAVGACGGRKDAEEGERERRRERAQRPGEGLDRAKDHHPILNTRRPTSRAGTPFAGEILQLTLSRRRGRGASRRPRADRSRRS